jgi:hypothetical protein
MQTVTLPPSLKTKGTLIESIHIIKKNTQALVVASKEIDIRVEANAEKTKYVVMSRDQNAGQNHNIKI